MIESLIALGTVVIPLTGRGQQHEFTTTEGAWSTEIHHLALAFLHVWASHEKVPVTFAPHFGQRYSGMISLWTSDGHPHGQQATENSCVSHTDTLSTVVALYDTNDQDVDHFANNQLGLFANNQLGLS